MDKIHTGSMKFLVIFLALPWCKILAIQVEKEFLNNGLKDLIFRDDLLFETTARSKLACSTQCSHNPCCATFTYMTMTPEINCRGHFTSMASFSTSTAHPGAVTYDRKKGRLARDCEDAVRLGNCSKIQTLNISSTYPTFNVSCDNEWTVILRRQKSPVDFNQKWQDYVVGFGDLNAAYWLGLEKIYKMTSQRNFNLRVELRDWDDVTAYADYEGFYLTPASDFYRLQYKNFLGGVAGDSLDVHKGMKFSTKDFDRDRANDRFCSNEFSGGWWYNWCHKSSLCAVFKPSNDTPYGLGIQWSSWKGYYYSLQFAQMLIKPSK